MRQSWVFPCVVALALLVGCFGKPYRAEPLESVPFASRAQTQQRGGIQLTAAVPTPEEAEALFGIPVYERRVQPVWLEVKNDSEGRVRFAPVGTDPDYFSPMEVWFTNRGGFSKQGSDDLQRHLYDLAMPRHIPQGATRSGFVFTHASPGTKSFTVDLFGAGRNDHHFLFFIDVPGFEPDHADVDAQTLFAPEEFTDVDEAGLRELLRAMPCCASVPAGFSSGLPVNVVLVGSGRDALTALLRSGWYEVARPSTQIEQLRSPQLYGRVPDAVFRLARGGKAERNELRIWMAPIRVAGEPVWVAQMTHYVERPTRLGTALLEARLDPDVDDARNYMLQRMWYSQALARFAFVEGERLDTAADLSAFFEGSRFFSDGHRLVLWLSAEPISLLEAENMNWAGWPARDHAELAK
jgi:hypothetical protein